MKSSEAAKFLSSDRLALKRSTFSRLFKKYGSDAILPTVSAKDHGLTRTRTAAEVMAENPLR